MVERLGQDCEREREPIRFRGRVIGPASLTRIRHVLRDNPTASQTDLSRRICEMFDLRRPNGHLALRACTRFLFQLARRGRIRLPASWTSRRRGVSRPRRPVALVTGDAFCSAAVAIPTSLFLRLVATPERAAFHSLMRQHHYLGERPATGECVRQVAFFDQTPVALLEWSSATLQNGPRDRWIGWDRETKLRRLRFVANNARFLMLPGRAVVVHNLASQVLSLSLRRLSADFRTLYGHPVVLAETFVDPSRFLGTCYRASNWEEVGQTSGWSRSGVEYHHHGRKKAVFLRPLHRLARTWLKGMESPLDEGKAMGTTMTLDVSKLALEGESGLFEVLRTIEDPRKPQGIRHSALSLLAIAATAVLAGYRSMTAIGQWAEDLPQEILKRLGCTRKKPPEESTFRRLFSRISAEEFDRKTNAWIARHQKLDGLGIAIDGKTLRGSADDASRPTHLVSAVVHESGVVVSQIRVPEKTNEITSVEPVLMDLDVKGAVVTGDAMFAQTAIAKHLVEEKGADYVFTVKNNQPTLRQSIENMGLESFSPGAHRKKPGSRAYRDTQDLGHG